MAATRATLGRGHEREGKGAPSTIVLARDMLHYLRTRIRAGKSNTRDLLFVLRERCIPPRQATTTPKSCVWCRTRTERRLPKQLFDAIPPAPQFVFPEGETTPKLQAWCRCYLFFLTTLHIIMFLKAALTFLAVGALSVNALTAPVARSLAPEPECESPRPFSITSYQDLTLASFNSSRTQGLDAQARSFIRPALT